MWVCLLGKLPLPPTEDYGIKSWSTTHSGIAQQPQLQKERAGCGGSDPHDLAFFDCASDPILTRSETDFGLPNFVQAIR